MKISNTLTRCEAPHRQGRALPERKFRSSGAPSCLPVGRDAAYPVWAGWGTFRPKV
jgi:hypothetical protein